MARDLKQCPNCGGFDTEKIKQFPTLALAILMGIAGMGIGLVLTLPWWLITKIVTAGNPRYKFGYSCSLCSYEWQQRPGETLPITVRPDLIQKGRARQAELAAQAAYKRDVLDR